MSTKVLFSLQCLIYISQAVNVTLPKLLIISFDGFRYDYLNRNMTPTLNGLRSEGISIPYITNVFPTQTFPNHFTVSTGLFSEIHGVLDNRVYDASQHKVLSYGPTLFRYNEDIVPIWTLNQRAEKGRHSGCMMWPSCEYSFLGIYPTFHKVYNNSEKWESRVDTVIEWFKHQDTPANLVMLYFEEPDGHAHAFGPNSLQTDCQIVRVNKITQYIVEQLLKNNLTDMNLVILSDHGMEEVPRKNIIDLAPVIEYAADMYGTSPVLQVYPKFGMTVEEVYEKLNETAHKLKTFKVYKASGIPEVLHYKNCKRAPPILLIAQPTYAFQDLFKSIDFYKEVYNISGEGPFGVHGYNPTDPNMHPIFLAIGPAFKHNYHVEGKIYSIDLYNLFAHTLNLELPELRPNGSFERVADLFSTDDEDTQRLVKLLGQLKLEMIVFVFHSVKKRFSHLKKFILKLGEVPNVSAFGILATVFIFAVILYVWYLHTQKTDSVEEDHLSSCMTKRSSNINTDSEEEELLNSEEALCLDDFPSYGGT